MAAVAVPFRSAASATLLPRLSAPSLTWRTSPLLTATVQIASLVASSGRVAAGRPLFPAISIVVPSVPRLLEGIWESILRAVPKKKTSHMKKRHRQMAGKAIKDVTSLCKCPACGRTKRMHYVCPYCMESIRSMLKKAVKL